MALGRCQLAGRKLAIRQTMQESPRGFSARCEVAEVGRRLADYCGYCVTKTGHHDYCRSLAWLHKSHYGECVALKVRCDREVPVVLSYDRECPLVTGMIKTRLILSTTS